MIELIEKKVPKTFRLRPTIIRMLDDYTAKSQQDKGDVVEAAIAFWLIHADEDNGKVSS